MLYSKAFEAVVKGKPGARFAEFAFTWTNINYLSYQVAFNRLDIMPIHELRGVVDEEFDFC